MKEYRGSLQANNFRLAVVISQFNRPLTEQLLQGAVGAWTQHGVPEEAITVIWVPGAFELPWTVQAVARRQQMNAIVVLGAILRGATSHYDLLCQTVVSSVAQTSKEYNIPITLGLLTVDTPAQAWERVGIKQGNKGAEAALAALEMASLASLLEKENSCPLP